MRDQCKKGQTTPEKHELFTRKEMWLQQLCQMHGLGVTTHEARQTLEVSPAQTVEKKIPFAIHEIVFDDVKKIPLTAFICHNLICQRNQFNR